MAHSTVAAALVCFASIVLPAAKADACRSTQRFPYAAPHVAAAWRQVATDLTPAQQEVIVAVVAAEVKVHAMGDGMNDRTLYFALPGGVLTLWYGEAGNPTGEFAAALHRCGPAVTTTCSYAYPVLGSPNIRYFPSRAGGPVGSVPEGLRWYEEVTEGFRPIDRIAKDAYKKYRAASPLSKGIDYFEPC